MESVEVWMWIIAGLLIGALIFTGAYSLLSRYMKHQEINQAHESFNRLKYSINTVCIGGLYTKDTQEFIFPYSVERIFVRNNEGLEGKGKQICIKMYNSETECSRIRLCNLSMSTLDLGERTSIFYLIQKALGKKMVANIEFSVYKEEPTMVQINWTRKYVK